MKDTAIFTGSLGMNTKDDPYTLALERETYRRQSPVISNMVVDKTFRPNTAKGYTSYNDGDYQAIFCGQSGGVVVKDDILYRLNTDLSLTSLRTSLSNDKRMVFVEARNQIFYSNTEEIGIVRDGAHYTWAVQTYVGPETDHVYATWIPKGHLLEFGLGGRWIIADEDNIWLSNRFFHGLYRLSRNFLHYNTRIRMVQAVADGLWVSDSQNIYWISGLEPEKMTQVRKADYPAIEGAVIKVNSHDLRIEGIYGQGLVAVFLTEHGICLGGEGGVFYNLTSDYIETEKSPNYLQGQYGSAFVYEGQIIFTIEP